MKYVDLFAGCGGLSLGFEAAGFELVFALEKSDMACETFYHNFIKKLESKNEWRDYTNKNLEDQLKNGLVVNELSVLLNNKKLLKDINKQNIDVVVGGPPCQGFSLAGKRNPNDSRNKLAWEYLEFVESINPKIVVIENVVGMNRDFKKEGIESPFKALKLALSKTGKGYKVQAVQVNAMHYGVPEHRPRLMLIAVRDDIAKKKNIEVTDLWESKFKDEIIGEVPKLAPVPEVTRKKSVNVYEAIADLLSNQPKTTNSFLKKMKDDNFWKLKNTDKIIENNSHRNHTEKSVERFRLYQFLANSGIRTKLLNIASNENKSIADTQIRSYLKEIIYPAKSPDGTLIAENENGLVDYIFKMSTKKHSQRVVQLDKPSPTVVTLPDDYVHPIEPRIFSVRELARFQSFPDAFVFRSKETTGSLRRKVEVPQYTQVGNAVAPLMAYSLAKTVKDILQ